MKTFDAVVIGAGVVGSSCALALAQAGLKVSVLDRGAIASGTTSAGEGNILLSDKELAPEISLAKYSRDAWFSIAEEIGNYFELEAKTGIALTRSDAGLQKLRHTAEIQRKAGIENQEIGFDELHELEPYLHPEISKGIFYPGDAQCQPMLAAAHMLREVRRRGGEINQRVEVVNLLKKPDGGISGVQTTSDQVSAPIVINATGTWAGEIAELAGSHLPIMPRKGFILVTTPAPGLVHRKVYDADYIANVASDSAEIQSSAVVEATNSGTILIGASRERIGFDSSMNVDVINRLAKQAVALFPVLASIELMRVYKGFRPYAPDHLPAIGEDALVPGLYHCAGHEGAGIGLAPGSAHLLRDMILQQESFMDPSAFTPARFQTVNA